MQIYRSSQKNFCIKQAYFCTNPTHCGDVSIDHDSGRNSVFGVNANTNSKKSVSGTNPNIVVSIFGNGIDKTMNNCSGLVGITAAAEFYI